MGLTCLKVAQAQNTHIGESVIFFMEKISPGEEELAPDNAFITEEILSIQKVFNKK